jgi:excisionase family DNA binding protein
MKKTEAPETPKRKRKLKPGMMATPEEHREYMKGIVNEMTTPVTAQKFILNQLNRFEWAITAVQVQPTPQDMERMARAIFRTAFLSFEMGRSWEWEDKPGEAAHIFPESLEFSAFHYHVHAALNRIDWQLFFDRLKGTKRFYSMPETSRLLGLTRQTLMKRIKLGELQAMKTGNGWQFPIEVIEDYLESLWKGGKP